MSLGIFTHFTPTDCFRFPHSVFYSFYRQHSEEALDIYSMAEEPGALDFFDEHVEEYAKNLGLEEMERILQDALIIAKSKGNVEAERLISQWMERGVFTSESVEKKRGCKQVISSPSKALEIAKKIGSFFLKFLTLSSLVPVGALAETFCQEPNLWEQQALALKKNALDCKAVSLMANVITEQREAKGLSDWRVQIIPFQDEPAPRSFGFYPQGVIAIDCNHGAKLEAVIRELNTWFYQKNLEEFYLEAFQGKIESSDEYAENLLTKLYQATFEGRQKYLACVNEEAGKTLNLEFTLKGAIFSGRFQEISLDYKIWQLLKKYEEIFLEKKSPYTYADIYQGYERFLAVYKMIENTPKKSRSSAQQLKSLMMKEGLLVDIDAKEIFFLTQDCEKLIEEKEEIDRKKVKTMAHFDEYWGLLSLWQKKQEALQTLNAQMQNMLILGQKEEAIEKQKEAAEMDRGIEQIRDDLAKIEAKTRNGDLLSPIPQEIF